MSCFLFLVSGLFIKRIFYKFLENIGRLLGWKRNIYKYLFKSLSRNEV